MTMIDATLQDNKVSYLLGNSGECQLTMWSESSRCGRCGRWQDYRGAFYTIFSPTRPPAIDRLAIFGFLLLLGLIWM
jgi:hypothetical protein